MSTPKSGSNDRKPHTAGGARELTPEEEEAELAHALESSDEKESDGSDSEFTPGSDEEDSSSDEERSSSEEGYEASISRSNSAEGELEEGGLGYALNEDERLQADETEKVWGKGYREEIKRQVPVQKGLDTKQENRRLQEAKASNWAAIKAARDKGDEQRVQKIVRLIREIGHLNVAEMLRENQAAAQDARKMREDEKAEREQRCIARDPALEAAKRASLMDALTGGAHATGGAPAVDPLGGSLGRADPATVPSRGGAPPAASSSRGGAPPVASSSRGGGTAAGPSRPLLGRILGAQQEMANGTAFFQVRRYDPPSADVTPSVNVTPSADDTPSVTGPRLERSLTHEETFEADPEGYQEPKRPQH